MNKSSLYSFSDGIEIAAGDRTWDVILDDNPLRDHTAKFPIYRIWRIEAGGIFLGQRWMRITGIFKLKLSDLFDILPLLAGINPATTNDVSPKR